MKTRTGRLAAALLLAAPAALYQGALTQEALAQGQGAGKAGGIELAQAGCPPGLAKKNPPCIPPGQAKKLPPAGAVVPADGGNTVTVDRTGPDTVIVNRTEICTDITNVVVDGREVTVLQPGTVIDGDGYAIVSDPYYYELDPAHEYYRVDDLFYRVDPQTGAVLAFVGALSDLLN